MATTARKKAAPKQLTTAQRLDSIIKSARKIMRKDKGLNGDLDRLPMLGSRLIDLQSQNMTVAASATADRKVLAHRS